MLLQQSSAKRLNTNPIWYRSAFMLQFLRCLLWQFEFSWNILLFCLWVIIDNNLWDKTIWIELQNIFLITTSHIFCWLCHKLQLKYPLLLQS